MDLSLTEEQELIRHTAQRFAETNLLPIAAELDNHVGKDKFISNLSELAKLGFMGLNIQARYGGAESDTVAFSSAITEIAKACASTAVTTSVTNMVAEVIQSIGTEEQKTNYLSKLCSGEYLAGAFCLTESNAGSDPSAMKTSAKLVGDEWVINGNKQFITSADYAGVFVVWAVTDKNAPRGKGISCFIVEAKTLGLNISPAENKMGQTASSTNEVIFENCRIPKSNLLGEINKGYKIAVTELAGGRIGVGSLALGIGSAAIDYATRYAKERRQFNQAISDFQGIQWKLADIYTELEAAQLLLHKAACLKDKYCNFSKNASMAKLYATEAANRACYEALQILGGVGYMKDYPIERLVRDVRVTTIYEGSSEIQRIIIAKEILAEM